MIPADHKALIVRHAVPPPRFGRVANFDLRVDALAGPTLFPPTRRPAIILVVSAAVADDWKMQIRVRSVGRTVFRTPACGHTECFRPLLTYCVFPAAAAFHHADLISQLFACPPIACSGGDGQADRSLFTIRFKTEHNCLESMKCAASLSVCKPVARVILPCAPTVSQKDPAQSGTYACRVPLF